MHKGETMGRSISGLGAVLTGLMLFATAQAKDQAHWWPHWRGPDRDNISKEEDLSKKWPASGPRVLWTKEGLGVGYASVVVVQERIFTTGMIGKNGVLFCLDTKGTEVWQTTYGPEWTGSYPGSRSTPTVDGKDIYLMSGEGLVACYRGKDGKKVWSVDTAATFGAQNIKWGISESVLVDGDNVICTPGGANASVVALNKKNGKTVWKSSGPGEKSAYCSPTVVAHGGKRIILTMTAKSVIGLDAKNGKLLWKHAHKTAYDVHANTPIYADGYIFATSGYGTGSVLLKLNKSGTSVSQVWKDKKLDVHHGGAVLLGSLVVGTGHKNTKGYAGIDFKSGAVKWEHPGVGKGPLTAAGGMVIGYSEKGKVGLMKATPEGLEVVSQFRISHGDKEHWAHPVVANGVLYIRHGKALAAYDLKGE